MTPAQSAAINPTEEPEQHFIRNMRRRRQHLGLSQSQLAKKLTTAGTPMHSQTVMKIETGARPVRLNEALSIAKWLGTSFEELCVPEGEYLVRNMINKISETGRTAQKPLIDMVETQFHLALVLDLYDERDDLPEDQDMAFVAVDSVEAWTVNSILWGKLTDQSIFKYVPDSDVAADLVQRLKNGWEGGRFLHWFFETHPALRKERRLSGD